MRADFADLCTYAYVIVDELDQLVVAPHDHRPGSRSDFSDSAVLTLTRRAELSGRDEEAAFLADAKRNHRARFPQRPERSRDNRRRRAPTAATNRIRGALMPPVLGRLAPAARDRCVVDRLPVPVVGCHQARGRHRWYGEARDGDVASKQLTSFGDKRHLLLTHGGLILGFVLAPAHHADAALTEPRLSAKQWLTVLGDQADLHAALQDLLWWRNDLVLLTAKRAHPRQQHPPARTRAIAHCRQLLETRNSQLAAQVHVERNQAKRVAGRCARLQAKLAAHPRGLYLNCLRGRPLLHLKDLALI